MSINPAPSPSNTSLVSRVLAAVLGAYLLAALAAMSALLVPIFGSDLMVWSVFVGFLVYAAAVFWASWARSARQAWLGLGAAGCFFLPFLSMTPY